MLRLSDRYITSQNWCNLVLSMVTLQAFINRFSSPILLFHRKDNTNFRSSYPIGRFIVQRSPRIRILAPFLHIRHPCAPRPAPCHFIYYVHINRRIWSPRAPSSHSPHSFKYASISAHAAYSGSPLWSVSAQCVARYSPKYLVIFRLPYKFRCLPPS